MNTSPLLINEPPLQVLPSLAVAIGLNEAIVLQQLHFWLTITDRDGKQYGEVHDGRRWIWNTVKQWRTQFPWWSENTVQRILKSLEDAAIIDSAQFDKGSFQHHKSYAINHEKLASITSDWGNRVEQDGAISPETTDQETTSDPEPPVIPSSNSVMTSPRGKSAVSKKLRTRDSPEVQVSEAFRDRMSVQYTQWTAASVRDRIEEAINFYLPEMLRGKYDSMERCVSGSLRRDSERTNNGTPTQRVSQGAGVRQGGYAPVATKEGIDAWFNWGRTPKAGTPG